MEKLLNNFMFVKSLERAIFLVGALVPFLVGTPPSPLYHFDSYMRP